MSDPTPIRGFRGKYAFLSNFHPCRVEYEGMIFPSAEHAFQAAKTLDWRERRRVQIAPSPGEAKKVGRALALREDWPVFRIRAMAHVLKAKFDPKANPDLVKALLDTGRADLVEENTWGDLFWGTVEGEGENNLGRLLVQWRTRLRAEAGEKREAARAAPPPPRVSAPAARSTAPKRRRLDDDFLNACGEVLERLGDLPEEADDFRASVEEKVRGMHAWSEEHNGHATEKMWGALRNMDGAVDRWLENRHG